MPSSLPLILLPPSEGKASGGDGPAWKPGTMSVNLDDRRSEALAALTRAMKGSEAARSGLLGVKGRSVASATRTNRAVRTSPTMPAIERYTGVLYDALDHRSLTTARRRRLDDSVLVFSGLWGLVAPADPIPDYKLKMGAMLPRIGKLSGWWRDDLTSRLAERAAGRRVWNLLPNEHAAAWRAPEDLRQWSVRFLERRPDGSLTTVSHRNKALKGSLVRWLLAHPAALPADLKGWEEPDGDRYTSSVEGEVVSLVPDR